MGFGDNTLPWGGSVPVVFVDKKKQSTEEVSTGVSLAIIASYIIYCLCPDCLPAGVDPNRGSEIGDGKESRRAVIITAS